MLAANLMNPPSTTPPPGDSHATATSTNPHAPSISLRKQTPPCTHRRRGKVARLPDNLRELVNTMLRDGAPYSEIIKTLSEKGYKFQQHNLSRWFSGGHQDWLKKQTALDQIRLKLDFASDLLRMDDSDVFNEACLRIAVARLYNLLLDFDPIVLKETLSTAPGGYSRILNALCKLTDGALKLERHRDEKRVEQKLARIWTGKPDSSVASNSKSLSP